MKIISLIVFVIIAAASFAADGTAISQKEYYALIIGVDQYQNTQSGLSCLKFAGNDVTAINELLLFQGWEKQKIKKISGKSATKKNLISAFNGWDDAYLHWGGKSA